MIIDLFIFWFSLLGSNPQILLAMTLHWNGARAAWRTLNPKEEIFMQVTEKFKRQIFMNNVMRIKNVIMYFVDMANWVDSCFEWESPVRSIVTFVLYEVSCYYSQPFWVPIILLLIFARNYIVISYLGNYNFFFNCDVYDMEISKKLRALLEKKRTINYSTFSFFF